MSKRATEKIIEALAQLLEGYAELQESIESELDIDPDDDDDGDDDEVSLDPDSATVTEMRGAIETVIENEDYTPEEIANLVAIITEALEEIDPNIFDHDETEEDDDVDEDDDDDYDDDEEFDDEDEDLEDE